MTVYFHRLGEITLPYPKFNQLTHWGRVTHICVRKLCHHCLTQWLVACSAPSHYLNIVNWTLSNKFQWKLNRNLCIFIHEITSENVVWKMAAILSRSRCVKIRASMNDCVAYILWTTVIIIKPEMHVYTMGLLPDTQNCGCACAGNAGNVFPVTAGKRSRHATRHVRHARAVMHAGIAN